MAAWALLLERAPGARRRGRQELLWRAPRLGFRRHAYGAGRHLLVAKDGDKPLGGIFDISAEAQLEGVPPHWFAYIAVDDVDARVAKATAAGAELLRPSFDVPGVGRIAILKDPTGAAIGWITPTAR